MRRIRLSDGQWLFLAVFFIYFIHLNILNVNIMEARNMVTAREMGIQRHWLLTTMNGLPRYEKPPLPTWITAIFGLIFGFKSVMIMRLPAALVSLMAIFTLYKFSFLLKLSRQQALINALVLATTFYMIFSGRTNQWDVWTHAFMLVSIFYLWKFLNQQEKQIRHILLSALFFGFSFMSKGPVSLYTLWLPFLVSYGIVYHYTGLRAKMGSVLLFLLLGFGIGLWWFIYVRWADPAFFLKAINQESDRWGTYNTRPFYYYWNFFLQTGVWAIPAVASIVYPYMKSRVSNLKAYKLALFWTAGSFLLLSVVPEKKPRYLLPMLIPLAMTIGFYVEYLFRNFKKMSGKESRIVFLNHGILAFVCLAFPVFGLLKLKLTGTYWIWFVLSSVILLLLAIFTIVCLKKRAYPKVFYITIGMIVAIMTFVFPLTDALIANPRENNIAKLRQQAQKEGFHVYEYGTFAPEIIWYYGEPIPEITEGNINFRKGEKFGIITTEDKAGIIENLEPQYKILKRERFDMNQAASRKPERKTRLVRQFFLLEKK